MKPADLLKLSTRMFKTRVSRTLLTILGVSVGIGTILFLVSLGYGLQKALLEQITTADALLSLDVTPSRAELVSLDEEKLNRISQIPEVVEISPIVSIPGQITLGNLTSDILIYAANPSFFRLGGITAKEGELFKEEAGRKVVLSSALSRSFNLEPSQALGKEVKFTLFLPKDGEGETAEIDIVGRKEPYQVSGIVEEEFTSFAYLPLNTLEDLEIKEFSQAKVKVKEAKFIDQVRQEIIGMGFLVSALAETVEEATKIFRIIQIILAIFGLIALIVSAIGMANTMTVTLLERTNEIGIMKAIGASDQDVGIMFLAESVIMGFLGGVGGIAIGLFASEIFNLGVNILARGLGGQAMDLFFTPIWFLLFIVVFSTFVGFLTGIFPARRASKMNPLAALRYK